MPAISTNHLADLARLPFRSNVDAYMEVFQAWATHTGDLSSLQRARLVTGGLPEDICVNVELQDSKDLQHAMRLALAYERRNAVLLSTLLGPQRSVRRLPAALSAPALTSGSPSSTLASLMSAVQPFKHLTHEEMVEQRKLGLCYNCKEQFV